MLREAGSRLMLMCLAASATGGSCCGEGPELNANVPSETVAVGAAGESLVLNYQGDTNLRFGSILVQLRLVGDATVLATVPGTAANEAYLPANNAELTQTMPEAVISPCIEHDSPSSVYDADCPEAFDLTLSVASADATTVPEVEVEVLTTAVGDHCTPHKAAYATFERLDSD
jgi:hypothetical protein